MLIQVDMKLALTLTCSTHAAGPPIVRVLAVWTNLPFVTV